MTNSQNSDSIKFNCIVLHPNTEQAVIEERKKILKDNVIIPCNGINSDNKIIPGNKITSNIRGSDWFEIFPLYGIFENGFSILKSNDSSKSTVISLSADSLKSCFFSSYFSFDDFLFFKAQLIFENEKKYFFIPFGVNKNAKDKTITSAFKTAQKIISADIKKETTLENTVSFKSFQITGLELTSNQYKTYGSRWIKTNPDEIL